MGFEDEVEPDGAGIVHLAAPFAFCDFIAFDTSAGDWGRGFKSRRPDQTKL
jgi:hypothetical protein